MQTETETEGEWCRERAKHVCGMCERALCALCFSGWSLCRLRVLAQAAHAWARRLGSGQSAWTGCILAPVLAPPSCKRSICLAAAASTSVPRRYAHTEGERETDRERRTYTRRE
jgi:hypothetical protein